MNSTKYLNEIIAPAIDDARANPNSRQKIYAAATQTYHIVDYIKIETGCSIARILREMEADVPEFKLIHSLATVSKHTKVDDPRAHKGLTDRDVHKAGIVFPCGSDGKPRLIFGNGTLVYGRAQFRVQFGSRYIEVLPALENVASYFHSHLESLLMRLK